MTRIELSEADVLRASAVVTADAAMHVPPTPPATLLAILAKLRSDMQPAGNIPPITP